MSEKILTLIPSKQQKPYSEKLMWALRGFITETGGHYYADRLSEGILTMYYSLGDIGLKIQQEICTKQDSYTCNTELHCHLSPDDSVGMIELLYELNGINCELEDGCFTLNMETGYIYFGTFYEPDEIIYKEKLDRLLNYPHYVLHTHCHSLLKYLGVEAEKEN